MSATDRHVGYVYKSAPRFETYPVPKGVPPFGNLPPAPYGSRAAWRQIHAHQVADVMEEQVEGGQGQGDFFGSV